MSSVSRVVDAEVGGSSGGLDASRSIVVCRLAAAAALGVAALYALSVPIGSLASLPATDVPGREILAFFADHRDRMLAAVVLNGIAWCALPTVPCALAMAIAIRRSRVLPAYTANLAIAVAAVHVLAGVGFARTGAFSPGGIALLGAPVFAVWMAVIGVALLRRGPEFVPARSDA